MIMDYWQYFKVFWTVIRSQQYVVAFWWSSFAFKAFKEWNEDELESFLIEITSNILKFRDSDGSFLIDKIRDSAGQVRIIFMICFIYSLST